MSDIKLNMFLMARSFKALQMSAYEPVRKSTGLNQMELQIIFSLAQVPGPSTVGDIHKQTSFNKGQISVCAAKLLEKGYLTCAKTDSRFEAYILSEEGKVIAEKLEKNTSLGRQSLLKGFTEEDVKKFESYLVRLLDNATELSGQIDFEE